MDQFEVTVEHRGSMKTFVCTFSKFGYSYRFIIDVDGTEVIFEPDEERNLRAIVPVTHQDNSKIRELVPLIGQQLSKAFSG